MRPLMLSILLAALLGSGVQQAQQPERTITDEDRARIISDVTRVNLLFTVSDRRGRFVTNLTKDDFVVREDDRYQKILEFTAESDLPLRLAILVDTSNSVRERFKFIQEAATEFVRSVLRPTVDKAVVVSFDTNAEFRGDLQSDVQKLEDSIRALRPGGGTSLYDAIYVGCRDRLMQDQPRHKFRRAVVILSDGEDNQSRFSRDQALEMAQKADAVIYTISTNISRIESDGDKVLKYLSAETGGAPTFFPFKVEDLAQSFENIANELRHQYSLLYRPEPLKTDGTWQKVAVIVRGHPGFVPRARKGYYSPRL